LPQLIKAVRDETDIFLTEGEKDADNLMSLGFTASSFKNWKFEFNQYVRGANLVLFADNDSAGLHQANEAAKILYESAATVKLINLYKGDISPETSGADVSDYINRCAGTENLSLEEIAERLCITADYAKDWKPLEEWENSNSNKKSGEFKSLLLTKTANVFIEEAKQMPTPKTLFDTFWLEGEICILFADTGIGKSVLAVQIADSITRGEAVKPFSLNAEKQTVLYFDCELSQKQFEKRYSVKENERLMNHYVFDELLLRAVIDRNAEMPKQFRDFEEHMIFSLEYEIARTGARVLIVDNITYLKSGTEKANDALPLMKELNRFKQKYNLSIMALAHTPKRDMSRPITINDLQGSKMLSNFTDSVFAIGQSAKDYTLRYLKQIKVRSEELIYHGENVGVFQLTKPENFLKFDFLNFGSERDHLKIIGDSDRNEMIKQVKELSDAGKTQREIARTLGVSVGTVNRNLKI